jgi:lysozyme family protein
MKTFDEIIEKVLEHEGGYVNDPKDLGGETKYGITKRFYPELNIKELTIEKAKQIYKDDYWDRNRVESLPQNLWHIYFDMCVNMGKRTAVKVLQRAAVNRGRDIDVDGGLGPATIGALKGVEIDRVRAYRVKFYVDLITSKPEQEKFFLGWFRRSTEV